MRRRHFIAWLSGLPLAAISAASLAKDAPGPAYRIIVHPSNPASTLDRRFLEDAFLKKTKAWPGGAVIRPVDLAPDAPVRRRFSDEVLRRPVAAVSAYWQQRIFSGRDVPPPAFDADAAVVAYVARHGGAVGYVSEGAALAGVKSVQVVF